MEMTAAVSMEVMHRKSALYNVFTQTFCYTKSSVLNLVLFFSEGMSRCNAISWDGV